MQTHSLANDTLHDFLQILKILGTIFIKNRTMKLSYLLNVPKQNTRRSLQYSNYTGGTVHSARSPAKAKGKKLYFGLS